MVELKLRDYINSRKNDVKVNTPNKRIVPRDQAAHRQEAKRDEFSHSRLGVDSD